MRKTINQTVVSIDENCDGCGVCVYEFECPAIKRNHELQRAYIDSEACVQCGQCLSVCPTGHIKLIVEKKLLK